MQSRAIFERLPPYRLQLDESAHYRNVTRHPSFSRGSTIRSRFSYGYNIALVKWEIDTTNTIFQYNDKVTKFSYRQDRQVTHNHLVDMVVNWNFIHYFTLHSYISPPTISVLCIWEEFKYDILSLVYKRAISLPCTPREETPSLPYRYHPSVQEFNTWMYSNRPSKEGRDRSIARMSMA